MTIIGVDSHKLTHTAVSTTETGQKKQELTILNQRSDYTALWQWAKDQDAERVWAIENCGSYGRQLAQYLIACGEAVYEVSPQLTARRRRRSSQPQKSDPNDAWAIARSYVMDAQALPRVKAEGVAQEIALLDEQRDNWVAERTRLINQLKQHLMQLEPGKKLTRYYVLKDETLKGYENYQPPIGDPLGPVRALIIRQLAGQIRQLNKLLAAVQKELTQRVQESPLLSLPGVEIPTAAKILGCIGTIERFPTAAHLASYGGIAPFEISSGPRQRHRVHLGGERQLNRAFHTVALCQIRSQAEAKAYYQRKRSEGKTKKESLRCLKRRLVDIVYVMLKKNVPYDYHKKKTA